jgi:hypothetical protein
VLKYTNKLKLLKTGLRQKTYQGRSSDSLYTQLVALRIKGRKTDVYKKIVKKSWPWPTLFSFMSANSFIAL